MDNIKWLARYLQRIEVPYVDLSTPQRKDLSGVAASGAIFKDSKLTAVDFNNAKLAGASFERSVLDNTTFRQAYLYSANFDRAEFCGAIDFTGADVVKASFKGTRFLKDKLLLKDKLPIFINAAWWQAYGWRYDEIEALHEHFPRDRITESKVYKDELNRAESRLEQAKDDDARAAALNQKAWTMATYGVVSDGKAEAAARQALEFVGKSQQTPSYQDTLAYILMQGPEGDPEKQAKNLEDAASLLATSAELVVEGALFRYAVALHALNKESEARLKLEEALLDQQYDPTHELYLLKRYITDEFAHQLAQMTGRGKRMFPTRCPPGIQ